MKSMLIIASLIAVALAGPVHRGLVAPGMPGPAPVVDQLTPIAVGPAVIDDFLPVHPVIDVPGPDGTPLVQIILNINTASEVTAPTPVEAPVVPEVVIPGPVNVVDNVIVNPEPVVIGTPELPGPVNVVDNVVVNPDPVVIGTPVLPGPGPVNVVDNVVVNPEPVLIETPVLPGPVNIVDNVVINPEAVVVGTPILPGPVNVVDNVVVQPEPIVIGTPVIVEPVVVAAP